MELNVSIYVGDTLKGSKKIQTPCLLGRSKEAGLTVAHPAMSRKHCELYEEGGKLFLRDNSSLNGTLCKGEYVENPVQLQFGDEFTVGELKFRVSAVENVSSEARLEIADRPTASVSIDLKDDSDDKPGMVTVLEPPSAEKDEIVPASENAGGKKPKISPRDVKIDFK